VTGLLYTFANFSSAVGSIRRSPASTWRRRTAAGRLAEASRPGRRSSYVRCRTSVSVPMATASESGRSSSIRLLAENPRIPDAGRRRLLPAEQLRAAFRPRARIDALPCRHAAAHHRGVFASPLAPREGRRPGEVKWEEGLRIAFGRVGSLAKLSRTSFNRVLVDLIE